MRAWKNSLTNSSTADKTNEAQILRLENFTFFNARESPVGFQMQQSREKSPRNQLSINYLSYRKLQQTNWQESKIVDAKSSILQTQKLRMTR